MIQMLQLKNKDFKAAIINTFEFKGKYNELTSGKLQWRTRNKKKTK